ncbi:rho GTPase-activating protein 12 isoform X2 [Oryzias melastigma]|uniref:rho GTPase-activating protein 12 isoform X2 n=1 Tax=Oryzias melastigma TaxID=30732 RepID=UPI000CF7BB69|nr:rho GTPase-activating protein 12 isoform X2 [Oryzias melastigma]
MAHLPIAPGEVYIEVDYDYEYKSKDRLISIHQGERYLLVKKTNEDWWQVKKDDGTKAFYVPAQYVREVRKALMPPPKPFPHHPGGASKIPQTGSSYWVNPSHLDLGLKDQAAEGLSRHESKSQRSPSAQTASSGHFTPPSRRRNSSPRHSPLTPTDHDRAPTEIIVQEAGPQESQKGLSATLPRGRARSPNRDGLDVDSTYCDSAGEDRRTNDSESGDELSGSSTEQLQMDPPGQVSSDSSIYTNLQELKISQANMPPQPSGSPLHVSGDWETHKDQTGRQYYYNPFTQERTWKPPRTKDINNGNPRGESHSAEDSSETTPLSLSPSLLPFLSLSLGRILPLSPEDTCFSTYSSQSESQYGSPPRGWSEEMDEYGHTLYVSDYTNEKWLKHVDDQGRPYYYSADGSRSEWELPKYTTSPPQLPKDVQKSQSLDRRTTKPSVVVWRNSSHFPVPSEKEAPLAPKSPSPDSDSCSSSPKPPASPSEKCGVLNMTKITENGRRVRKNWTSSWTVLQGSELLFAKGQASGSSWFGGGQSKPEFAVDLKGASVEWASKDKSSKKNVIELKIPNGTDLLIQSDNDGTITEWFNALEETIRSHACESDDAIEEDLPESPGPETKEKKDSRVSKKEKGSKAAASTEPADTKKTKHKLKKFLTRRPTLQAVRDRGYIKDQVFGCSLASLCQRENSTVPHFVKLCIDHVESKGLSIDGLYRVSGNLAVIQKLRFAVNHDEKVNLSDAKWEDIHVTTGALKMFFRELPEPLFTYALFQQFVTAIKTQEYRQRVQAIKDLVKQLPKPNHDTMQTLFKHLRRVIDHGEENRMTTQSIAIVFGPTLLRPETETWNMAVHMVYQNQIVDLILLEYENIFSR